MRGNRSFATGMLAGVALVGLVLGALVFRVSRSFERARAYAEFAELVDHEKAAAEHQLVMALESLHGLRSFFHASEFVSELEFRSFASELRHQYPVVQAFEWSPAVDAADRIEHERQTRAAGHRDYLIREREPGGKLVPAGSRSHYFPVRYVDPVSALPATLGFDVGSDPRRRQALQRSAQELRPSVSDPLGPEPGSRGEVNFIAALPLERFAGDRVRDYLRGSFLLAQISLDPEEDLALTSVPGPITSMELSATGLDRPLLAWSGGDQSDVRADRTPKIERQFDCGGRTWMVRASPSPQFLDQFETRYPLAFAVMATFAWFGVVGFGTVTSRLVNERSRRRQGRILDSVLSAVDEGIVVADRDGRLLLVNEAARRYVGEVDDALSVSQWPRSVGAYRSDGRTLYDPADLPLVRAMRGEAVPPTEVYVRNRFTPAGAWVTVTGKPLVNELGERTGGVVVIRDHTLEKESQAMVERLSQAVESTADAVFILRQDGSIEYVNEAFVQSTGLERKQVVGRDLEVLDGALNAAGLRDAIESGDVHRETTVSRRADGTRYAAQITIAPMREEAGRVSHFVAVMKDVSATLEREAQKVELRLAAQVQRRLYPQHPPDRAGWEFAGLVIPAEATCGDYYDFLEMSNGHMGIAVGDVCGHGLGPALVMSEVRALLRSVATVTTDPARILGRVNSTLADDLEDDSFVTLLLAAIETDSRQLEWVNAGHPAGYVMRLDGSVKSELGSQTIPLGILPELDVDSSGHVSLDPGDLILMVTDGVLECGEDEERSLGPEGVVDLLRSVRTRPVEDIARTIADEARFRCPGTQSDDVTLVVIRAG